MEWSKPGNVMTLAPAARYLISPGVFAHAIGDIFFVISTLAPDRKLCSFAQDHFLLEKIIFLLRDHSIMPPPREASGAAEIAWWRRGEDIFFLRQPERLAKSLSQSLSAGFSCSFRAA